MSTTRKDLESKIIDLAWKDPNFKAELMQDPHAALEQGVEMLIPASVKIKVVEESPDTLYIVLPMNPDAELSESELEGVAGGAGLDPVVGGGDEVKPKTRSCLVRPNSGGCSNCF